MARRLWAAIVCAVLVLSGVACDRDASPKFVATIDPAILPVRLSIASNGTWAVDFDLKKITKHLGSFSIKAGAEVARKQENGLTVVIRDTRKPPDQVDTLYLVEADMELEVIVEGTSRFVASRGKVVIDVSDGKVRTIEIRDANAPAAPPPPPAARPSSPPAVAKPVPRPAPTVRPAPVELTVGAYCWCSGRRGQETWKVLLGVRNRSSRPMSISPTGASPLRLLVAHPHGAWRPPSDTGARTVTVRLPDGRAVTAIPPNEPHRSERIGDERTFATIWRQRSSLPPGGATDCSTFETYGGPRSRCSVVFYVPANERTEVVGVGYVAVSGSTGTLLAWLPLSAWEDRLASPLSF